MTTFRLNAGKPATYQGGRLPARKTVEETDDLPRARYWAPNMEPDTPLACGDTIPWPVIQAFGQHIHGQIWCSDHGWQPKITKAELQRVRKVAKQWHVTQDQQPLSTPDEPPF